MFRRGAESELDYDNEQIEYRIVTKYEDAYKYNSPGGHKAPKTEVFKDVNEKNYKKESTKREKAESDLRNKNNHKNNHRDTGDGGKTIWGIIITIIFLIFQMFF